MEIALIFLNQAGAIMHEGMLFPARDVVSEGVEGVLIPVRKTMVDEGEGEKAPLRGAMIDVGEGM